MTLLNLHPHLNREGPERAFVSLAMSTHRGQAHLAGSGPIGMTCRSCRFWQFEQRWSQKNGPFPGRCAKYRELMRGEWGPKIPHHAGAYRHFDAREKAVALVKPERAL